jgi:hypothetical protein
VAQRELHGPIEPMRGTVGAARAVEPRGSRSRAGDRATCGGWSARGLVRVMLSPSP